MAPKVSMTLTAICSILSTGCVRVGPSTLQATRPAYNMAVQHTNNQELLLNIVRSRYRDNLYFTSVERIAATQELNQSISTAGGVTTTRNHFSSPPATSAINRTVSTPFLLGGTLTVIERPTIFYVPVEGEKFIRQMMTPMNPELLLQLVKAGWSIDRVFALGVAEINELKNAPTAGGHTPAREPEFRDFHEAIRLLRTLQNEQLIDLVRPTKSENIELRFTAEAMDREETKRLKTLLKLDPTGNRFKVVAGCDATLSSEIVVSTRPLIFTLTYLSQGVDVPEADYVDGRIRRTSRSDGQPFDWQELLGDVFHVRVSEAEPAAEETSTSIQYRGHWFYIPDNDLDTKSTFVLLTQLISLNSASSTTGPSMVIR